ncbi:MAG TPA: beta-ketoacyl synthase N-terminal-like domain-containing protein [Symbiobacteriaceae bacterium]|nr:beta-ketoacyl synthase N-terminal-like domain-containing protein [Symbiobacteriaceae bacterium]
MRVAIVGAGQTAFGAHPTKGIKELFAEAVTAMGDSVERGWSPDRVEVAYIGCLSGGQGMQLGNLAPALMEYAGLPPVPALHVESACASGGFALLQAIMAVASGQVSVALAAGVEKMRDVSGEKGRYWLGISGDTEYERLAGLTFAGVFGLIASRLLAEGLLTRADLARVAVKNHAQGALNPKAMLRSPISLEQALGAPLVASPLGLYDCCPTADGAAAVLVVDADLAPDFASCPIEVAGVGAATDSLALHARPSITRLPAAQRAAAAAYRQAGVGPSELDLAEVHDCFTVAELIAYAELGFCSLPEAGARLAAGEFGLGGRLPVNPSGGLKAKGHPIGATGVGQVVELFGQLRGEVEPARQVAGAEVGLAYNMGGSGASATAMVLRRGGLR